MSGVRISPLAPIAPWWNGRRARLKIGCPHGRTGSSPVGATIHHCGFFWCGNQTGLIRPVVEFDSRTRNQIRWRSRSLVESLRLTSGCSRVRSSGASPIEVCQSGRTGVPDKHVQEGSIPSASTNTTVDRWPSPVEGVRLENGRATVPGVRIPLYPPRGRLMKLVDAAASDAAGGNPVRVRLSGCPPNTDRRTRLWHLRSAIGMRETQVARTYTEATTRVVGSEWSITTGRAVDGNVPNDPKVLDSPLSTGHNAERAQHGP